MNNTAAFIVYGILIPEGCIKDFDEELLETESKEFLRKDPSYLAWSGDEIEGIEIFTHGSGYESHEESGHFVSVTRLKIRSDLGRPIKLSVLPNCSEHDAKLVEFCKMRGLPDADPGWWLVARS